MSDLKNVAMQYAVQGLSVIPVKSEKIPAVAWSEYQSRIMSQEQIEQAFSRSGVTSVGIVCGAVSGNLEVIDVDCKYDDTGTLGDEFLSLLNENLPYVYEKLLITKTINKGYHIYYRCATIAGNQKLASTATNKVLIETRGEGGYVIAPPSPGYTIDQGSFTAIPVINETEREVMFVIASSFQMEAISEKTVASEKTAEPSKTSDGLTPFEDYNLRGDVVELLERHGWTVEKRINERIHLKRPGKNDDGVSGNFHERLHKLYVFSTSSELKVGPHSPANVYAQLECAGDLSLAAKKLLEAGYGQKIQSERTIESITSTTEPTSLLPIDGMPRFIRDYIDTCTDTYRTPRDYWASSVITSTALAIGDKFVLRGQYDNWPILWVCNVGPSSSGKTHPMELCMEYFTTHDESSITEYNRAIREVRNNDENRIRIGFEEPQCFQYVVKDITPEALVMVHSVNKRGLLIYRDEFKGWIDDFNRYSKGSDQSNMLSSFNRVTMTYNRKGDNQIFCIEKPWIAVAGGMQPDLLPGLAKDDRAESGFLARMLFVYPDKTPKPRYSEKTLPEGLLADYQSFLDFLANRKESIELKLSDDAKGLHRDWYNKNADLTDQTDSGYLKGVYGKFDIYVLRLAVVIKAMCYVLDDDANERVTGEQMQSAIEMVEYFRQTALKVYGVIFENAKVKNLDMRGIARHLYYEKKVSVIDIAKAFRVDRKQIYRYIDNK